MKRFSEADLIPSNDGWLFVVKAFHAKHKEPIEVTKFKTRGLVDVEISVYRDSGAKRGIYKIQIIDLKTFAVDEIFLI